MNEDARLPPLEFDAMMGAHPDGFGERQEEFALNLMNYVEKMSELQQTI